MLKLLGNKHFLKYELDEKFSLCKNHVKKIKINNKLIYTKVSGKNIVSMSQADYNK